MTLYGTPRDISFFRTINKELINNIIQTEIDYYKVKSSESKSNIYGESVGNITYYKPVRLACLINHESIVNTTDDMGVDTNQTTTFSFLRDGILDKLKLVPEIGDIISWDEKYFEINNVDINQYLFGKNDLTDKSAGTKFGSNWSYICKTNLTRRNKLVIEKTKFGRK